jgi:hypothetical protein
MQIKNNTPQSVFIDFLNQPKVTMADEYIRANQFIDAIENYFLFNIDDVPYDEIREMSLNQLSYILTKKIEKYKKYIRNTDGYFYDSDH